MILATTTLTAGLASFTLALLVLMRDLSKARRIRKYAVQITRTDEDGVEYTRRFKSPDLQEQT